MLFGFRKRVLAELAELRQLVTKGFQLMGMSLDDLITSLNDNTNAASARMDKLLAEIAAAAGQAPTAAQFAELQAISDHLKALGSDPANPVPPVPPAAPAAPPAA